MKAHITLITLGVEDLARARAFYCDGLGWPASAAGNEHVVFIQAGHVALALWSRAALAEDARIPDDGRGFRGVALAHNVASREEVDAAIEDARRAGATVLKDAREVFWGGYSGYFVDPDGHIWEVAHNPFWPLDENGGVNLP